MAATFTVSNLNDSGAGSLRQAIAEANAVPGAHSVVFQNGLSGTIGLSTAMDWTYGPAALAIQTSVTITGPAEGITLERTSLQKMRLFNVLPGATLTLEGLTLAGGYAQGGSGAEGGGGGGAGLGGAIFNAGTLNVHRCLLRNNSSVGGNGGVAGGGDVDAGAGGGGLYGSGGKGGYEGGGGGGGTGGNGGHALVFAGGYPGYTAGAGGGGALPGQDGQSPIGDQGGLGGGTGGRGGNGGGTSQNGFPGGIGGGGGGGGTTGNGNTKAGGAGGFGGGGGGGTYDQGNGGAGGFGGGGGGGYAGTGGIGGFGGGGGGAEAGVSGIGGFGGGNARNGSGGGGAGLGGAIFNYEGMVNIENSTFTANIAQGGTGGNAGSGHGGAVFSYNGECTVLNATVSQNSAAQGATGIYILGYGKPATYTFNNSIIGGPSSATSDVIREGRSGGSVIGQGSNNLIRSAVGVSGLVGTITADPSLATLANNGGPTQTMAPQAGSPVANAGLDAIAAGLLTDQRGPGFPRVLNGHADLGAVEWPWKDATSVLVSSSPSPSVYGEKVELTATVTRLGGTADVSGEIVFRDGASELGRSTISWVGGLGIASLEVSTLDVGTRTLRAEYSGDANYLASTGSVQHTVGKATPAVNAWPGASGITYGQQLSDSLLSGGDASVPGTFSFDVASVTPAAGSYSAAVSFHPADSTRYKSVQGEVLVAVAKATPAILAWPTASGITYGDAVSASLLSGGNASTSGQFSFDAPSATPGAGSFAAPVTFTPTDLANYNPVAGAVTVSVAKAEPAVSAWPVASAIIYGQSLANSALTGGIGSVAGEFAFTDSTAMLDAGTHSVSVVFAPLDTANYRSVSGSATIVVGKATPVVTVWPAPSDITYGETVNGSLLVGGSASVSGTFSYDDPTAAPVAGNYVASVTFTPQDTSNYEQVPGTVTIVVNKATPTVNTWPGASGITYGDTVSDSTLTGGNASVAGEFSFDAPSAIPSAGSFAAPVTFTPADVANYNPVTGTVNIAVAQATPVIAPWPTATGITYGQTVAMSALSGGSASIAGEFTFDVPTALLTAGTHSVPVTFTPGDSANYNSVNGSATIVVSKATPTIAQWPTASEISYGMTVSSATLTGGNTSVPGSFAYADPSKLPNAGTYLATVVFTPADTDNYTEVFGTINVVVARATPTVWVWPQTLRLVYGQTLTNSALNPGDASVPGNFEFNPDLMPRNRLNAGVHIVPVIFVPIDNLQYHSASGFAYVTVDPAPLKVVVTSHTRNYGAPNPEFGATFEGLVSGDAISATFETAANESSAPGVYPIEARLLDPENKMANYTVTTVSGSLTVLPRLLGSKDPGVYVLGGDPAPVDPVARVEDAPGLSLAGGLLRVAIPVSCQPEDKLSILALDSTPGNITVSGPDVSFNGTHFGTVAEASSASALSISLNSNATCAAVNALLHQLAFATTATNVEPRAIETALVINGVTVSSRRDMQINRAPVAANDDVLASAEVVLAIPHSTLLGNDSDPDGEALRLVLVQTNSAAGANLLCETNHIIYAAVPGHQGLDHFEYQVEDARGGRATGTVTLRFVQHRTIQLLTAGISGEGVRLSMGGVPGQTYAIEASSDLIHWEVIDTVTSTSTGVIQVLDATAKQFPQRFYRAVMR